MSALLNNQAQNFMDQWTTNVARAGVIVSDPFSFKNTSTSPSHKLEDENYSLSPQFSPLQASTNSSCISIDSLQYEPLLDAHGLNREEPSDFDLNDTATLDLQSGGIQPFFSVKDGLLYNNEPEQVNEPESFDELICNHPLMEKLEQLKEWQQEKQEQLKKQQMEQLQRLLEKQQKVLGLITTRRDLPGQGYFQQSSTGEPLGLNLNSSTTLCSIQQISQSLPQINTVQPEQPVNFQADASLVASMHFSKSNSSAASASQQQRPESGSHDFDHVENHCPVNGVQQMEDNTELENAVGHEGEFSVREQPDPEPSVFRDVPDAHNTNENCLSAAYLQSPSEKNNSNKVVSFKTLEERPIKSNIDGKSQTFEEFLEEQIRIEDQRFQQQPQRMEFSQPPSESTDGKTNQKRTFLKRGEGLTRFSTTRPSKLASVNADKQIKLDSYKSVNTTQKQVGWKTTSLNKENRFDGLSRIGNKSNPVIKPKSNPSSFKKVTVLGNRHGENALQVEKKVSVSFDKVYDVSKIEIDSKIGKVKDVYNCTPSNTGQGNMTSNGHTSLDNGGTVQTYKGNTVPTRLNNDPDVEPEYSFDTSFQKALTNWDDKKKDEKLELDEFEFLEQAANELSFSSNSSFLLKMIQPNKNRRLSSTPIKSPDQQQQAQTPSGFMSSKKGSQTKDNVQFSICNGSRILEPDLRISNVELKENFRNVYAFPVSNGITIKSIKCDLQGEDCCSRSSSDSDDLESTLTDELEVNVKRVEYTSDEDDDPKSNCGKHPTDILNKDKNMDANLDLSDDEYIEMATVIENKRTVLKEKPDRSLFNSNCVSQQVALNQEKLEFDDDQTWMDFEEPGFVDHEDNSLGSVKATQGGIYSARSIEDKVMRRKIASTKKEDIVEEINIKSIDIPPTSDLVTKLFPSLRPKPKTPSLQGLDQKFKSVNDRPLGDGIHSKLLRDKMVELECEIEKFRAENVALVKLREDREKALEDLRKEIADFERTKTEELSRLEEYKKEELRKLQKERKVFEKYTTAARAIPDKKEREEIQALKQQIADLQEEVKRKDLRWSNTHTRLRSQIESLTKENLELRDEVKVMERLRLEAWKKAEAATDKKVETSTIFLKRTELPIPLDTRKKENSSVNRQVDKAKTIRTSRKESTYRSDTISPKVINPSSTMKLPLTPINQNIQREPEYVSPNKVTPPLRSSVPQPANRFDSAEPSEISSESRQQFSNVQVSVQAGSLGPRYSEVEEEIQEEVNYPDGKVEQVLKSGRHIILFRNGTRKEISADRRSVTVTFFNGDVKEMLSDQTVIYYYADAKTTHTTYPDGLEVLQFPNNQTEKHYPDGRKEITFPDQTIKYLFTDGHEESVFPDGTIIQIQTDGNKIIEFNNGQREIHTSQYKRREYPDGTIKTVYQNGQQETKYISGRIRIKDKEGNIIMDSKPE